jgi:predicted homoserine dehydrogenase-like protein
VSRANREGEAVAFAMIGAGAMGKGLLYQSGITAGVRCVALADRVVDRAIACAVDLGVAWRLVDRPDAMHDAIRQGLLAIVEDGDLCARCELAEVLVEASSAIAPAGAFAVTAIEHGKHLILMNAEIDLAFGPALLRLATRHGVTYTSCDGDQHGVIARLVDEVRRWGFELVMAGNIKGFLDRYANPETIVPEADLRRLDYRMATAYTDGTKLSVEMALVANGLQLDVLAPGMMGPRAGEVRDVLALFDFAAIRSRAAPVADYILGAAPGGGVFAIGHCEHPYQRSMLAYYKMGDGPFYLFYRPYHLCHIEAMEGLVAAARHGRSLLRPDFGLRTNVYAHAKRFLRAGERLDGVGGFTCYGLVANNDAALAATALPICLAEDVTLIRDVAIDASIHLADVRYDPRRLDFSLHAEATAISGWSAPGMPARAAHGRTSP